MLICPLNMSIDLVKLEIVVTESEDQLQRWVSFDLEFMLEVNHHYISLKFSCGQFVGVSEWRLDLI